MAEKDQEHLRIRLDANLLKRIDAVCERDGRTRTNEIERRLIESFMRTDLEMVAEMAVHNVLLRIERVEMDRAARKGEAPLDFAEAMVSATRREVQGRSNRPKATKKLKGDFTLLSDLAGSKEERK